jgi:hypothetical protein
LKNDEEEGLSYKREEITPRTRNMLDYATSARVLIILWRIVLTIVIMRTMRRRRARKKRKKRRR